MTVNSIARSMRECREKKMVSRRELSQYSGVPYSTIGAAEAGTHIPNVLTLAACARALNLSLSEYIGE